MGIDVEFQAVIPKVLTERETEELYEEMADRFDFRLHVDTIVIVKSEDLDFYDDFKMPEGYTLLDFKTLCRLYAQGYERGDPVPWITYAEYIEWKYAGAWVSYSGDSYVHISPWTKEAREELKLYYFENCRRPYGIR